MITRVRIDAIGKNIPELQQELGAATKSVVPQDANWELVEEVYSSNNPNAGINDSYGYTGRRTIALL